MIMKRLAAAGAMLAAAVVAVAMLTAPVSAQDPSPREEMRTVSCTTNGYGYCTIEHDLGVVPVGVQATSHVVAGLNNYTVHYVKGSGTETTFRVRAMYGKTEARKSLTITFSYELWAPAEPPPPTTTTTTTTTTVAPPPPSVLDLPLEAGHTGPEYYSKFPAAQAWDDPGFFPVGVFLGKPDVSEHVQGYLNAGVNFYQAVEHNLPLTAATNAGLFVMPQQGEWTQAEVGNNPKAVAWFISDECEMGYSGCGDTESGQIAKQREYVAKVRAYDDGRMAMANFGNGVLESFWSPNTMDEHTRLMDLASVDKYAYTSPGVRFEIERSPAWHWGSSKRAATYGWFVDQMEKFNDKAEPVYGFVEVAKPYLNESGAETIGLEQLEGAVWASVIAGADGIVYFDHNNDSVNGNRAIVDGQQARKDKVKSVNAELKALAPVINAPTRVFDYSAGARTMTKQHGGSLYVFAGVGLGHTSGAKTFTLPAGVSATSVEVVGEGRTLLIVDGKFTDSFAAEYSHHVYKIEL
jgi:hypothetical protein